MNRVIISLFIILAVSISINLPCSAQESDPMEKVYKLEREREYDKAVELLESLLQDTLKDDGRAHYAYARYMRNAGDYEKAKHHYEESLRLEPYSWNAEPARRAIVELDAEIASDKKLGKGTIGIRIDESRKIVKVSENSPAQKSRLLPGDKIVQVNSVLTASLGLDAIVSRIRGPEKTFVTLVIERKGKRYTSKIQRQSDSKISSSTISSERSVPPITIKKNLPEIIASTRKTKDSSAIEIEVKEALSIVPQPLLESLKKWGLKIKIVPNLIEDDRSLAGQVPRGYTHGGGYDNCGGLFRPSEKTIYISESVASNNHPYQRNNRVHSTLLHEFGHAYDSFGSFSSSGAFIEICQQDQGRLTNETRRKNAYFLQADEAGRREMFAELFSVAASNPDTARGKDLSRTFPAAFKYVKQLVPAI